MKYFNGVVSAICILAAIAYFAAGYTFWGIVDIALGLANGALSISNHIIDKKNKKG